MNFSDSNALYQRLQTYIPNLKKDEESICNAVNYVVTAFPSLFGNKLREIRARTGVSQRDISKKFNVTPATYSYWETGVHPPRVLKVKEIVDVFNVDPSELIPENPILEKGSTNISIPVIESSFLNGVASDYLPFAIARSNSLNSIVVGSFDICDFAFHQKTNDMMGEKDTIPYDSYVLCSYAEFDKVENVKRFEIAIGKVALVSICSGPAILREIMFDGSKLTLIPWNKNNAIKNFPIDEDGLQKIEDQETAKWAGFITLAQNVQIHAIAKKIIKELI